MSDPLLGCVRKIREVLDSRDAPLQVGLVEAGQQLWAAVSGRKKWPADLQEKAQSILERLLAGGTIQTTVAQMDANTVRETAKDILDLGADLDAARNRELQIPAG